MTRSIYALLVGIDKYQGSVPTLKGCVNDITAIAQYLKERVAKDQYQLHLKTLLDEEATRQAIIDGFCKHLCNAQSNDTVLFYYSGHGSQEQAPEEFGHLEPDGLNETLVCYDSRLEEGWDLADKELAKLIHEVSAKNPHITIILDCCHSGSGTKNPFQETGVRLANTDQRKRPVNSFIFQLDELEKFSHSNNDGVNSIGLKLPKGRHILLGSCQDSQLAKEFNGGGQQRGAFSYFLMDTLQQANGKLTYRDLFNRAKAIIGGRVLDQSPQLETSHPDDENQFFLDGAIAERTPYFTVSYHKTYNWVIDGGAVHGVQNPANGETTLLALFPFDANIEDLREPSKSVGEAKVTQVLPQLSQVNINGIDNLDTDKTKTFKAVITSLPLPPLGVHFEGEETGVNLARQAIQSAGLNNQPSPYIREENELTKAQFRLLCRNNQYLIARPADDRPLVAQIDRYTPENAEKAIQRLEHIARWNAIAELPSSGNGLIQVGDVEMKLIFHDPNISQSGQMRLEYQQEDNQWKAPSFRLKLTNKSQKKLYCALVNLTDSFAICVPFFNTGSVLLKPGEEAWALDGQELELEVPDELWEQGITEFKDIIKLIVCTAEFDARLLTQEKLDFPRPIERDIASPHQNSLNRLMNRVQSRDIKPKSQGKYDDWFTDAITITTVRPLEAISISSTTEKELATGVKLQSHPSLKANARLTTIPQVSRDLGNVILPTILRKNPEVTQTFQFTTSRGSDPGLSVLELSEVEDYTVVTPDAPLQLLVDTTLGENEHLLPVGYDGEFFLPLGQAKKTKDGKTKIQLQRLPKPFNRDRSIQGSIKILFQKIVSEKLGLECEYPLLRVADIASDETTTYIIDKAQIKAKVAKSQRILLYIHGIVGDTDNMVKSVQRAKVKLNGKERLLKEDYDLVLTFDYENLHTSIEDNARLLKKRLEEIGLKANHGKALHIVAHSMGGLVSRWFIEREGGNKVVQHLIMLGTPNAGSPWSTVQEWATFALAIGLNSLSGVAWPAKVLGCLVSSLETIDVSLDQMKPGSEFLKSLAANSHDPGIPYSVIAGNTSIKTMPKEGEEASQLKRLMQKLCNRIVEFPFLGQMNDIAVTVQSIKSIPGGRKIAPVIQEIACDHLTYFDHPEGLKALGEALTRHK
ncbi:Caspase domain-containing protein [Planktothrix serta PCC 8927]|uniref:Caspase domain-containing protein n=1 Tax=Planktothrix serta PCC 8927 TaxID=671068 RepID=A0A7Z9DZE4_9CYAN|nr:caspase family protein [Planktothrix serta]VXD17531.1 Caspase domain-containing protein [Planktothrix serta PCC 8927]